MVPLILKWRDADGFKKGKLKNANSLHLHQLKNGQQGHYDDPSRRHLRKEVMKGDASIFLEFYPQR